MQLPKTLVTHLWFALFSATAIISFSFFGFLVAEPQISHSQATEDFWVRQTITGEQTFLVNPSNVTMDGDINGLTGGNATGSSQFVVQSNSGYYVTINFENNAGQYTMYGDATGSEDIFDYRYGVGAEPDFGFTPEANASFAYTVAASSSPDIDLDDSFKHNNTDACNTGAFTTEGFCWATPSSTEFRIIESSASASAGATSTVTFRVNVPAGATPIPAAESYTATATLSLYTL